MVNDGLNQIISTTTRLAIMAALAAVEEAEFSTTRDNAGVSDSVLSKQATALEAAGYLTIRKGAVGRRPRTWLSLTPGGRTALHHHITALRRLVDFTEATRPDHQPHISSHPIAHRHSTGGVASATPDRSTACTETRTETGTGW